MLVIVLVEELERKIKELLLHYPFVLSSKSSDDVKIEKISKLKVLIKRRQL